MSKLARKDVESSEVHLVHVLDARDIGKSPGSPVLLFKISKLF